MTTTPQHFTRPWREDSQFPDTSDFTLAEIATDMISSARYEKDPQAHLADVLPKTFTYDEMRRITEYLAACTLDTSRLAQIEARADLDEDARWLATQLRCAWDQLAELRRRIEDAGSLMHTTFVAAAVRYPRQFSRIGNPTA
ncbi:hypothetical protein [Streptomyces pseudogriseolus]|uniref:hypothetical protein n=1 Tax=Streptomyces pseudogriseolus TaxID=36817 RepID=UPI003FA24141